MRTVVVHEHRTIGDKVADGAAQLIGSWRFIIWQTAIVALWITLNVVAIRAHWDPYPFILLNLLFSTQAAYTGPILLLAANRQAAKDRIRDDRDDQEIGEILDIARTLHALQHDQMDAIAYFKGRLGDNAAA